MSNPDPNTGELIAFEAHDPDPVPVTKDQEAYVVPDPHTPEVPPEGPEDQADNLGPFDADRNGTDAAGRPLNAYGRYEGQHNDEEDRDVESGVPGPDGPLPQALLDEIEAAEHAGQEDER